MYKSIEIFVEHALYVVIGYSFEPRTNSCALGTAGSISYDH